MMGGTKQGGQTAATTIKERFGHDYYQKIGTKGGKSNRGNVKFRGFASMEPERHRELSAKGGAISRRPKRYET